MRRTLWSRTVLAVLLGFTAASAGAQQAPPAGAPIEPEAISALKAMSGYLRTLKVFQVDAVTTDEEVLDDGQKVQSEGKTKILAQFPDRLYADVKNDRHDRIFLYDGKTFTLFARRLNLYAAIPAPPTIGKLARVLNDEYDFTVPLEDLFLWGAPEWTPDEIKGAMDLGPSDVLDTTCEQYAFRQKDIDWQIWIQKGDHPLPRKLVITSKTDEARPQHTAVFNWNLAPSFNAGTFVFDPPAGVAKAVFPKAAK